MSIWSDLKTNKIKSSKIERILGPFPAMRHGFIYKESRYPVRQGTKFYVIYDTNKNETYMSDTSKKLIPHPRTNFLTTFGQYKYAKEYLIRERYLKAHMFILTEKIRENNAVTRYFAKNVYFDGDIFEIREQDMGLHAFYKTTSISWQLQGSKEDIKTKNERALEQAEKELKGMKYFLDPLQYYEEELTSLEKMQKKLSNLKY